MDILYHFASARLNSVRTFLTISPPPEKFKGEKSKLDILILLICSFSPYRKSITDDISRCGNSARNINIGFPTYYTANHFLNLVPIFHTMLPYEKFEVKKIMYGLIFNLASQGGFAVVFGMN